MKVFIADDSRMVCERLTALLAPLDGVTIAGRAHNVGEAIESIRELKPEVVILDIQMPGGTGFDVLRRIKNDGSVPVVIVLTNFAFPQYRQKYLEAGADYFLDKSKEFLNVLNIFGQLTGEDAQRELVSA